MDHFLRGFVSELVKTAVAPPSFKPAGMPAPAAPKPASTGSGASPGYKPRANLAPSNKGFAIPKQRLESPAATSKPTGRFRPSPTPQIQRGYGEAKPTKPKAVQKKAPAQKREGFVPWETASQRWGRMSKEKAHNIGRARAAEQKAQAGKAMTQRKAEAGTFAKWYDASNKGTQSTPATAKMNVPAAQQQRFMGHAERINQRSARASASAAREKQQAQQSQIDRLNKRKQLRSNIRQRVKAQQEYENRALNCFPPGTPITLADWSQVPIEKVRVGDTVVSWLNDDLAHAKVVRLLERDTSAGWTTINEKLKSTPEHPYFTQRGWVNAGEIVLGDKLLELDADGSRWIDVSAIETAPGRGYVYNMTVDTTHNYVANGVLVHNKTML